MKKNESTNESLFHKNDSLLQKNDSYVSTKWIKKMNHCCKWRHQSHLNLEEDTYIVVNRWKTLTYFMGVFQRRQDVSRTTCNMFSYTAKQQNSTGKQWKQCSENSETSESSENSDTAGNQSPIKEKRKKGKRFGWLMGGKKKSTTKNAGVASRTRSRK
jgi:hypothetical protein